MADYDFLNNIIQTPLYSNFPDGADIPTVANSELRIGAAERAIQELFQ